MYWWTPYAIIGLAGYIVKVLWEQRYKTNLRSRMRMATWTEPSEPNMYGTLKVDVTDTLEFIEEYNRKNKTKITMTHLVGKALGIAMKAVPASNVRMLCDALVPRGEVNISFLVDIPTKHGKNDLTIAKVNSINEKSLKDVATALGSEAGKLREGKNKDYNKTKNSLKHLPMFFLRQMLTWGGWVSSNLGVSVKALGVVKEPFGGAMVTSVAKFDLEVAYAPFTPFAGVPVIMTIGKVKREPMVIEQDGEEIIAPRDVLTMGATVDHRYIDGSHVGQLATIIRDIVKHPEDMNQKYGEYMK